MTEILILTLAILPLALILRASRMPQKVPVRLRNTPHKNHIQPRR